ncbi:hypothetical protein OBP_219 [Pseudomonas phage OBP]|uniref:hypothetical protein n=1 Tax=Pseudomonas phage OBP TaxID=1124849 RepID=UPI000240D5BF|nr:hypothetical protein OBP_219 [Pseudomonas phage OBP]AEV89656.1 hypothetical protein OBP_219 [Pseudomonas phage OBP]
MKYISSFIHVPTTDGQLALDVTAITSISGHAGEYKCCVMTTGPSPVVVDMNRDKLIDMVEQLRRQIWENQQKGNAVAINLLTEIAKNTTPEPSITQQLTKTVHFGNNHTG